MNNGWGKKCLRNDSEVKQKLHKVGKLDAMSVYTAIYDVQTHEASRFRHSKKMLGKVTNRCHRPTHTTIL